MLRKSIANASLQRNCSLALSTERRLASRYSQMEGEPGSAAIPAEGVWDGKRFPHASMANPRVIFPWRHDTELLPRLVRGSDEFELQGGYYGPGDPFKTGSVKIPFMQSVAAYWTGVPWYEVPFSGWKKELATSSAWAFTQAVAEMMSNLHRVSIDDVRREGGDFDVDFKHTTSITTEESLAEEEAPSSSDLDYMIEEKLLKMYKHAHDSGRDQMQIHLQMQVTSAKLLSLVVVPFFSREDAKEKRFVPSLTDLIADVISLPNKEFRKKLQDTRMKRVDGYSSYEHTVIAQVLVNCEEVFSVTDLKCGSVLQGYGDGKVRNVTHVVRLESAILFSWLPEKKAMKTVLKGWQITDWDDMLGGNIWFS